MRVKTGAPLRCSCMRTIPKARVLPQRFDPMCSTLITMQPLHRRPASASRLPGSSLRRQFNIPKQLEGWHIGAHRQEALEAELQRVGRDLKRQPPPRARLGAAARAVVRVIPCQHLRCCVPALRQIRHQCPAPCLGASSACIAAHLHSHADRQQAEVRRPPMLKLHRPSMHPCGNFCSSQDPACPLCGVASEPSPGQRVLERVRACIDLHRDRAEGLVAARGRPARAALVAHALVAAEGVVEQCGLLAGEAVISPKLLAGTLRTFGCACAPVDHDNQDTSCELDPHSAHASRVQA